MRVSIFLFSLVATLSLSLATSDSSAGRNKIEVVFHFGGSKNGPASVLLNYGTKGEQVVEFCVTYNGQKTIIPSEELTGITDIRVSSLDLMGGAYSKGTPGYEEGGYYHYIDVLYGEPDAKSADGYKRLWFIIDEKGYVKREQFVNLKSNQNNLLKIRKSLATKPRGKTKIINTPK